MARKIKNHDNKHPKNFTKNIHSTVRSGTELANMDNWNEKEAKEKNRVCCHDCRYYNNGFSQCSVYIGAYHKPCAEFEWW